MASQHTSRGWQRVCTLGMFSLAAGACYVSLPRSHKLTLAGSDCAMLEICRNTPIIAEWESLRAEVELELDRDLRRIQKKISKYPAGNIAISCDAKNTIRR